MGISPWQYPPLFFLLLSGFSFVIHDEVLALKLVAALLYAAQPLSIYAFARRAGKLSGLVAAFASSVARLSTEMLGWGGYPNLLGFALLRWPLPRCFLMLRPLLEALQLLAQHNISYVALPRLGGPPKAPLTLAHYQHLLLSKRFHIAYMNERVIVLRYEPGG